MNVKAEVYNRCKVMIERELWEAQSKLIRNKREIKRLADEQRILKSQTGELFNLLNLFTK